MQIGIRLPSAGRLQDVVAIARRAEAAGLDMAWLPDSPLNYREVWSVLGAIAVSTKTLRFGTAATNFSSRHLTVTASAARTISEAAPGRFTIGIGAGDSAVGFDTLRPAKVAEMEVGVQNLRRLLAGEPVVYGDFEAKLRGAHEAPPILLAATGPRTLTMAGRVADGVIVSMGEMGERFERIAAGAAESGRPMPKVYVICTCGLVENEEESLKLMKVYCARVAQMEGAAVFEKAGFKIEGEFLAHKVGAHGDIGHAANVAEAAKALDEAIPDDAARWYMKNRVLVGSEADIEASLQRLADAGVAGVYLAQPEASVLPNKLIDLVAPIALRLRARAGEVK
jgi:5,10-methylenetetrahydromethanopterin reductase